MPLGIRRRSAWPLVLLTLLVPAAAALADPPPPATPAPATADTTSLPLAFELNEGQAQRGVKALVRGKGYGVLITESSFVLSLTPGTKAPDDVLRFTAVGGNPDSQVSGLDPLPGRVSYYVGNDSTKWHSGIRTYARVRAESVYPGIDLIYYGNQRELEYDFVVAPGADASAIRLDISGAQHVRLEPNGDLAVVTKHGTVVQRKPLIYQDVDGARRTVDGRFVLNAANRVSFAVGEYDRGRELSIDPSIGMLTYFGGTGADQIKAIAVTSPSGLTIFGGLTTSPALPADGNTPAGGPSDAFVSVMNSNGTSVLLTLFLGGLGTDSLTGLALDPAAVPTFLMVTGLTNSGNFPSMNAAQPTFGGGAFDAFVTRFNLSIAGGIPTATMAYSTYLGGTNVDLGAGVAVSTGTTGFATFVTGSTLSTDFPTINALDGTHGGAYDAFLTRFDTNGTVVFSTYLGAAASEQASGVAVQNVPALAEARPFVTGTIGLPGGSSMAFVFALNAAGSALNYVKTFGAQTAATTSSGIAVDTSGAAYITGETNDAALPVVAAVQPTHGGGIDAYVAKFDGTGTTVFATYMGGSGHDRAYGIAVDTFSGGNNNIIIAGVTSGNFPATSVDTTFGGAVDGFAVLLKGGASYTMGYATYLGGAGSDVAYAVCVGSAHNARVAGITNSPGLATAGVAQPGIAGGLDGFVTRINTTP